jgi:acetyl esterase
MSTEITDPEVLDFIAQCERLYPADAVGLSVDEQRQAYDALCAAFRQPRPEGITVTDETVDGPDGPIPQRRYAPRKPRRVTVVYYHGGGYSLGSLDTDDDICAEIADRTRCQVISVGYRLCPEHPHPAAYHDALAAARAAIAAGPVVLVGNSAGGNLAAAVAQTLKGERIRGQVLIYPALGGELLDLSSYTECADAPLLTTDQVRYYQDFRAGGPVPEDDPTFFPLAIEDFSGLPPCFISAAGVDPLRDDGVEYDRCLVGDGVEAYCAVEPQLPHGFLRARHSSHRARAAFSRIIDAISEFSTRRSHRGGGSDGLLSQFRGALCGIVGPVGRLFAR